MKKLSFVFVLVFAFSISAKAQFIIPRQEIKEATTFTQPTLPYNWRASIKSETTTNVSTPTVVVREADPKVVKKLSAQAQVALSDIQKGRDIFFIGVGTQVLGGLLIYVPSITGNPNNESTIAGGLIAIAGTIIEICGIHKWEVGTNNLRDIRIMAAANGFIIEF